MRALIFGAKGSIGNYIFNELGKEQIIIIGTTSNPDNVSENIILVKNDNLDNLIVVDPFVTSIELSVIFTTFTNVVWV